MLAARARRSCAPNSFFAQARGAELTNAIAKRRGARRTRRFSRAMRTTAVSALRAACHRAGVGWSTATGPRATRRTPVAATSMPHRRAGWRGIATGAASDNQDRQPETRTDEEAAAAADRAAFERMTVAELKDLLRARGQRVGGKKAELVERATSPESSVGAGFSTSTAASRDRSSSSSASTAAKKKPKSPPRMVWEVTDPPLPAPPNSTRRPNHPSRCSPGTSTQSARCSTRTQTSSTTSPRARTRTWWCCRRPSCRQRTSRSWTPRCWRTTRTECGTARRKSSGTRAPLCSPNENR